MATQFAPTATLERAMKGQATAKAGAVVSLGGVRFRVQSSDGRTWYLVDLRAQSCTCPDNRYRGVLCKHLHASRQAVEPARIRVQLGDGGTVTGWRYYAPTTAPTAPASAETERQERIAKAEQIADELFPF